MMFTRYERDGAVIVVQPEGDLHKMRGQELENLESELEAQLARRQVAVIIIDLTLVAHIGSGSVGPFVDAHKRMPKGRLIVVAAPRSAASKLFEITKLDKELMVKGSLEEALHEADAYHP